MVVITVTDSRTSPTSEHFARMVMASLKLRRIEPTLLMPRVSDSVLNHNTSESLNSDFMKQLHDAGVNSNFHIRTFDPSLTPQVATLDFVVARIPEVSDKELSTTVLGYFDNFSDTEIISMDSSVTFCSNYSSLVLSIPSVVILISEGSSALYRAAADDLAEVVEQFVPRKTS
jgi:hypothetical protein